MGRPRGSSNSASLSGEGRLVAFYSPATNRVADDTNGRTDVFVRDRTTGVTTPESVNSGGAQSNGFSFLPAINADGSTVVFTSAATNLTANEDTNRSRNVQIFDNLGWDVIVRQLAP